MRDMTYFKKSVSLGKRDLSLSSLMTSTEFINIKIKPQIKL